MIATPSRTKMVIVRERPTPYSDSTSKNTLKKFISTIIMNGQGFDWNFNSCIEFPNNGPFREKSVIVRGALTSFSDSTQKNT